MTIKQVLDDRDALLDENRAIRERRITAPTPTDIGIGFVAFRIPEQDMVALRMLYPDLLAKDATVRHEAWKKFYQSPMSEPYRVAKNANEVKRSVRKVLK